MVCVDMCDVYTNGDMCDRGCEELEADVSYGRGVSSISDAVLGRKGYGIA